MSWPSAAIPSSCPGPKNGAPELRRRHRTLQRVDQILWDKLHLGRCTSRPKRAETAKRSSNRTAKYAIAAARSITRCQPMPALGIPRNRSLIATSSLRKLPWLLKPLHDLVVAHVLAAERLHTDDAPVPVLTKDKTVTARSWVYVRDDQPFAGLDPPATLFRYSRDRSGDHPVEHLRTVAGILQADAYADYNRLYDHGRSPRPVTEALCWAHDRRRFYELAEIAAGKRRGERAPPISPLEHFPITHGHIQQQRSSFRTRLG